MTLHIDIFCLECASKAFNQASVCPECRSNLGGSEDIVITKLNPTEEYKSSVLAGLRPETIMDICSRAISFYEYQASQEINYRALLQKKNEAKFNMLYEEYKLATRELNYVLKGKSQNNKFLRLTKELESERRKNQELDLKFQEKSKQFQKLQVIVLFIFSSSLKHG
ncbi:hypothetical protein K501DRAFT_179197 [Backusella circina FSU 941]|nr:hypothetical protein K501DRAFT_179197 [Backusella circina FSU 941]